MKIFRFLLTLALSWSLFGQEIVVVHAFDGFLNEKFIEIVEEFNRQSQTTHVTLKQAKNYKVAYEEGIKSHKEGQGPHILQVYEVATLSMMLDEGRFVPVGDLLQQFQTEFDPGVYLDVVRKFYSAPNGKMLSLPWNASTGILFYNKKAFEKAGLDPERPPQTWPELERMGKKLKEAGYIGFTTAWPAAYHLEHVSCWHDIPYATHENGFQGSGAHLECNHAEQKFHIKKVAEWSKEGIFSYSGRYTEEPERRFAEEECAILLQGANRLPILKSKCNFEIGVGFMPFWPHLTEKPHTLNIGGSSFWALSGFTKEEYRSIAEFFTYLSSQEPQKKWHQATGYLPITYQAYFETRKEKFYDSHPAIEIAVLEVMGNRPTDHSWGMRLRNYVEVRELIIDYLEKAFSGEMTADEALDQAVLEGNKLLDRLEK
jgi:sn-glycerol 3-phosphate transport system substrate-binding protein